MPEHKNVIKFLIILMTYYKIKIKDNYKNKIIYNQRSPKTSSGYWADDFSVTHWTIA